MAQEHGIACSMPLSLVAQRPGKSIQTHHQARGGPEQLQHRLLSSAAVPVALGASPSTTPCDEVTHAAGNVIFHV